jgi:hypothetical protein
MTTTAQETTPVRATARDVTPVRATTHGAAPVRAASRQETAPGREGSASAVRRHELAAFLRHRREHVTPEQVGLPRGLRRRTPGLRREEVAQLSAVGVTWYTWLEQARNIQVSVQVLDSLARALLLDSSERAHLFNLAGAVDPTPSGSCSTVTPAQHVLLKQLEPLPACVQNSRYDILAYNRTYGRLLCDLDTVPVEDRNCILLAYTHPQWRTSLTNREEVLRLMAAKLRASMAEHLAEPAWKFLLNRLLTESEEFVEIWQRHEVVGPRVKRKQFHNSRVGLLTVDHTDLWLGPRNGPRLVTYAPADDETRARLERLQALPA